MFPDKLLIILMEYYCYITLLSSGANSYRSQKLWTWQLNPPPHTTSIPYKEWIQIMALGIF